MEMTKEFTGYDGIFATKLRSLMSDTHTTQAVLAEKLQVSRQAISAYMDGSSMPTLERFHKICAFFEVSSDYLLGRTSSKDKDITMQQITDKTGLSSNAINKLEELYRNDNEREKIYLDVIPISVLDYMLSNSNFINEFIDGLLKYYYQCKQDEQSTAIPNDRVHGLDADMERYFLINTVEQFIYTFYHNFDKVKQMSEQKRKEHLTYGKKDK